MKEPKVVDIKKIISGLSKLNKKYVTSERLSGVIGIYPDLINEILDYFEPTIKMDPDFNLMELIPKLKQFVNDKEEQISALNKKPLITKRIVDQYESIGDFVYKKMTIAGGLMDKNAVLTEDDLKILKHLVIDEINKRKRS